MTYRVKAAAAVIKIGGTERYLYKGNIVPEAAINAEHLHRIGLLEEITLLEILEADSPEDEQQSDPNGTGTGAEGGEQAGSEQGNADGGPADAVPPPKAGPGSSAEAWRAYAEKLGVEVDGGADRAEVIAALEASDKPTE